MGNTWRVKEFSSGRLVTVTHLSSQTAHHSLDTRNGIAIISCSSVGDDLRTPIDAGKDFFNQLMRAATDYWARDGISPAE